MNQILFGKATEKIKEFPDKSMQMCVTSPPYYGLRDYGVYGQIGLEETPEAYIDRLVGVFREVKRILKDDGTLWVNIGDSYARTGGASDNKNPARELANMEGTQRRALNKPVAGLKSKDLIGIPWMLAFALRADGWYLRQDIIWHKPNPMPESVKDRCTKAHEYIFLLSKSQNYFFDHEAIQENAVTNENRPSGVERNRIYDYESKENMHPESYLKKRDNKKRGEFNGKTEEMQGRNAFRAIREKRNKRSVWSVATKPYSGAHFAVFPEELITPCILSGSKVGDVVFDPFMGSGTTASVAKKNGRKYAGTELNPEYGELQEQRIKEAIYQPELF